jgi:hypothetical protein
VLDAWKRVVLGESPAANWSLRGRAIASIAPRDEKRRLASAPVLEFGVSWSAMCGGGPVPLATGNGGGGERVTFCGEAGQVGALGMSGP